MPNETVFDRKTSRQGQAADFWLQYGELVSPQLMKKQPSATSSRQTGSVCCHVDVDMSGTIDSVLFLLGENKSLIVEADGLLCLPAYHDKTIYLKGAVLGRVDEEIISISGLMVDHPGSVCKGFGGDAGWHYKAGKGIFERIEHKDDCPCNQWRKHKLELSIIRKLQFALENKLTKHVNGICYITDEEIQQKN